MAAATKATAVVAVAVVDMAAHRAAKAPVAAEAEVVVVVDAGAADQVVTADRLGAKSP